VHSHDSNCIYSVAESNGDSIKFSLSIAEQRAVGFIPAWSLAFLHTIIRARMVYKRDSSVVSSMQKMQQKGMSYRRE